ncbi:MAG: hypothetical protein UHH87_07125, partial [Akkermansia sp.]|nr:hypothetical protein [Akkermansia sp.]
SRLRVMLGHSQQKAAIAAAQVYLAGLPGAENLPDSVLGKIVFWNKCRVHPRCILQDPCRKVNEIPEVEHVSLEKCKNKCDTEKSELRKTYADNSSVVKTYDAYNRPTDFTRVDSSGSTSIHCEYDHMGRRATKQVTTNGSVTLHQRYIYRVTFG